MTTQTTKQRSGKAVNEAQSEVSKLNEVGEVSIKATPAPTPKGQGKPKQGKAKGGQVTESDYKRLVLNPNKALKEERKSFGHCISYLLQFSEALKLEAKQVSILKAAKKDLKKSGLLETTRPNVKTGNYSPFYVLQGIYRLLHPSK